MFKYSLTQAIFDDEKPEVTIERLARLGYDGIELPGDLSDEELPAIEKALQNAKIPCFSINGCFTLNRDLASIDDDVRCNAVSYVKRCIDLGSRLGASTVIVLPTWVGNTGPGGDSPASWMRAVDSIRRCSEMLEDDSPKLVLEPLNRYENHLVNTIGSALKFVAEVGSPKVGVMGDSFHMNIEEANSSAALEEAGNRLWHFHFSDNTRQAPGMGNQNLEGILRGLLELGYKGTITMEFVPQWYDERGIARRSREMADFESMAALAIANLKNLERKVRE